MRHYKCTICEPDCGLKQETQCVEIKGQLPRNGFLSQRPEGPGNLRNAVLSKAFSSLGMSLLSDNGCRDHSGNLSKVIFL
jgi:hypothetical protein